MSLILNLIVFFGEERRNSLERRKMCSVCCDDEDDFQDSDGYNKENDFNSMSHCGH